MKNLIYVFLTAFASLSWFNAKAQWSDLGALNASMASKSMLSDASGNIYVGGYFQNSGGNRYVAKFNGTAWSELGGANTLAANSIITSICRDASGNIYAGGDFFKWVNTKRQRYVAKFNGTVWSDLGGTNALVFNSFISSICCDAAGNIYAAGDFTNGSGKRYVAKFNGTSWSELGGTNALAANKVILSICKDASGNIYAGGDFTNSSNIGYVAKYNGISWSELGGTNSMYISGSITTICTDASNNIYAGGNFSNGSYYYVAKYNGTSWSELGGTNALAANNGIYSICSDVSGNIYASGDFFKTNGLRYIVKYKGDWGINFGPSGTIRICSGGSVTLTSNKSGSSYKYQWYKDKVPISGATSSSYIVFWNKTGNYFVRVDSSGFTGSSPIKPIIVVPIPKVDFNVNKSIQCLYENNYSFIDISTISSGQLSRFWNFGAGTYDTSSLISPKKKYSTANSYSVKLIAISDFNCKDSVVKTITVNPMPQIGFSINKLNQCLNGNNFSFVDSSTIISGKLSRIWNFGTRFNDTSSLVSPTKKYSTANSYSVKLVSISNFNCKDSVSKNITVHPNPIVGFTINNIVQCLNNNNYLFTDTSTISSGKLSRIWSLSSGINDTTSSISTTKKYSVANSYSVKLVSKSDFNCMDSIIKTIKVNPNPVIGIISGKSNSLITNNPYIYSVNLQANLTYQWLVTNGSIDSGQITNRIVTKWLSSGVGNLTSIVTDTNNCTDSAFLTVSIGSSGLRQLKDNSFKIFPNPIEDIFNIKTDSKLIGAPYIIYNHLGQVAFTGEILTIETKVDLSSLSKGVYFMSIGGILEQSFRLIKL
jgi:hypothetical protein